MLTHFQVSTEKDGAVFFIGRRNTRNILTVPFDDNREGNERLVKILLGNDAQILFIKVDCGLTVKGFDGPKIFHFCYSNFMT